jgi:hypothetical protein
VFQKDETVRYAGRNMLAGKMQRTPTTKRVTKECNDEDYHEKDGLL